MENSPKHKGWSNSQPPKPEVVLYGRELRSSWDQVTHFHSGLTNLFNTCYLNASIQALFHIPSFVDFLENDESHRRKCFSLLMCTTCALYRTLLNMRLHKVFKPQGIVNLIPKICRHFKLGRREDAHEFLAGLHEALEVEELERYGKPFKHGYCSKQTTAVGQIFGGWSKSIDMCVDCGESRVSYDAITQLYLSAKAGSVQNAIIECLGSKEVIEDYSCKVSCHSRKCERTFEIHKFPKVLKILIQRFDFDGSGRKNDSPIVIDHLVSIIGAQYKFASGVVHVGETLQDGHYTCITACPDGSFTLFDDALVYENCQNPLTDVINRSGIYVAFYHLQHVRVEELKGSTKRPLSPTPTKRSPFRKKFDAFKRSPYQKKFYSSKMFSPRKRKLGKLSFNMTSSDRNVKQQHSLQQNVMLSPTYARSPVDMEPTAHSTVICEGLICSSFNNPELVDISSNDILAKALNDEMLQDDHQSIIDITSNCRTKRTKSLCQSSCTDQAAVSPVIIRRTERTHPKISSSQSDHSYCIANAETTNHNVNDCDEELVSISTDQAAVSPLIIRRTVRTQPKTSSSQSEHSYCVANDGTLNQNVSISTDQAAVSPVIIRRTVRTQPKILSSQSDYSCCIANVETPKHLCGNVEEGSGPPDEDLSLQVSDVDVHLQDGTDLLEEEETTENEWESVVDLDEDESCIIGDPEDMGSCVTMVDHDEQTKDFTPVFLTAADVPNSNLPHPVLHRNKNTDLRRYLKLRDFPQGGNKNELVQKVTDCRALGIDEHLDPKFDGGILYAKKRDFIMSTQDASLLPNDDIFPEHGWDSFPSRTIPHNFTFGSIYHYLVETMPQCDDLLMHSPDEDSGEEEDVVVTNVTDPFESEDSRAIRKSKKLRRGLQYVKSGYVVAVEDCFPDRFHVYKGHVRASMETQAYWVKVAVSQISGSIIKCVCDDDCSQSALGRCSHVSALLLHILIHKQINGCEAITCTSRPCAWGQGSLKRNPSIASERQYQSFKIDVKRRATFDPRPTQYQTGYPRRLDINSFLAALSYKDKPCSFQTHLSILYEDFSYCPEDLAILREQRGLLYESIEELHNNLKPTEDYSGPLEVTGTEGQSENERWHAIRGIHATSSPCRQIRQFCTGSGRMGFLRRHMWNIGNVRTKQMSYGIRSEAKARKAYIKLKRKKDNTLNVRETGVHLHTKYVGLSCSHDGWVTSSKRKPRVMEIKCPYSLRKYHPKNFDTVLQQRSLQTFCLRRDESGKIKLKKEHAYYDQVQMEMAMTEATKCEFVVWSRKGMVCLVIPFDEGRWDQVRTSLAKFHWEYMAAEYFAKRTPRKLEPVQLQ